MIGGMSAEEAQGVTEEDPARVPTVWLFLPLPQPIGLPEGRALARTPDAGDLMRGGGSPTGLDCSLYVHQVDRSTNIMLRDNADVMHLAIAKAFKRDVPKEQMFRELELMDVGINTGSTLTIIEAAVPDCEATYEDVNAALDLSIELIQELQTYVALVTGYPVRLLSRTTLSPTLVAVSGSLFLDGRPPLFKGLIPNLWIEGCGPPSAFRPDARTARQEAASLASRVGESQDTGVSACCRDASRGIGRRSARR